jgi:hypothetical protein
LANVDTVGEQMVQPDRAPQCVRDASGQNPLDHQHDSGRPGHRDTSFRLADQTDDRCCDIGWFGILQAP